MRKNSLGWKKRSLLDTLIIIFFGVCIIVSLPIFVHSEDSDINDSYSDQSLINESYAPPYYVEENTSVNVSVNVSVTMPLNLSTNSSTNASSNNLSAVATNTSSNVSEDPYYSEYDIPSDADDVLLIDKDFYALQDPVIITINDLVDAQLMMDGLYTLYPNSLKSVYIPTQPGYHELCLLNSTNKQKRKCISLFVQDPDADPYTDPEPSPITNPRYIFLEGGKKVVGRPITIKLQINDTALDNYSLDDYSFFIRNNEKYYRLLGIDMMDEVVFVPDSEGTYVATIQKGQEVLETANILVFPELMTEELSSYILPISRYINQELLIEANPPELYKENKDVKVNIKDDSSLGGSIKVLKGKQENSYDVDLTLSDPKIKKAYFNSVITADFDIGLESPEMPVVNQYVGQPVKHISFDPRKTVFSNGTISVVAEGNELWKCKEYDFDARICKGNYVKVMDLVPGQEYDIEIYPEDPLWTETTSMSCSCSNHAPAVGGQKSTAKCDVYCPVNLTVLSNFSDAFVQSISYNVTITIFTSDNSPSASHYGNFDGDQTRNNGNESRIGSSTSTTTTTVIWTNSSINPRYYNKTTCSNWASGYCTWYVYLNSTATTGGANKYINVTIRLNSMNYTWNYTEYPPQNTTVTLMYPNNTQLLNNRTVNFTFMLNTTTTVLNCSLFDNETSWSNKGTTYAPGNDSINNISKTFGTDGSYTWNVICYTANSSFWSNSNRTFTIDTTSPNVNLMSPNASQYLNSSAVVTFSFNVSDMSSIANCSLYVNDTYKTTLYSIAKDVEQSIDYYLENSFYTWYMQCFDIAGNWNVSTTRNFTLNYTQPAWTGTWYETSTQSYTTQIASISLANARDGTDNNISTNIQGIGARNIINATTPYFGANGVLIPASTGVSFSGIFIASDNKVYISWHLDIVNSSGNFEIANYGNDGATGNYRINPANTLLQGTGTDTITSATRLLSTDRLMLRVVAYNSEATNPTFTHYWDNARSSYVILDNWINLGYMYVDLIVPATDLSVSQNDVLNITCAYNCTSGTCITSRIFVQYNTSNTTWTNIGSSGAIVLNGTQQNNVSVGNVSSYSTTVFWVRVNEAVNSNIRCIATSDYSNANGTTTRQLSVSDAQNPVVTQVSPADNNWTKFTTTTFVYTATDNIAVANCSLYINGAFNASNSTIGAGNNNFTVTGFSEGNYNWSILCFDTSGNYNMTSNRTFYVDTTQPSIILTFPADNDIVNYNNVNFNFTFNDNLSPNGTCNLYIDGLLNESNIAVFNGIPKNVTKVLNVSYHNWSLNCSDLALNRNASLTYYFNITSAPPVVVLDTPGNNTWLNYSTNVVLKYNLTDGSTITNCSLYVNGQYNQTNTTTVINPGTNNFTFSSMSNARYNWSVFCFNDQNLSYQTSYYNFYVDTGKPNIALVNPGNASTQTSSANINFQFNVTDNLDTSLSCNITFNNTVNNTSPISATAGALTTYPINNIPDGFYYWNVTCWDDAYNTNISYTYSVNVSVPPTVTAISPVPPPTRYFSGNVTFNYTATDNSGILNCSLYIDNQFNQSNASINTSGGNYFYVYNMVEYQHTWYVNCTDINNLMGGSGTNIFYIDNYPPNVTIINPGNGSRYNASTVLFQFNASDSRDTVMDCNLSIDGAVAQTGISANNNQITNVSRENLTNGEHYYSVACWDNALNVRNSVFYYFNVSVVPNVTLIFPNNYYYNNTGNITFIYNVSANPDLWNCSLYINGQFNQTNSSAILNNQYNNFTLTDMPEGRFNWSVECYDNSTLNLRGTSETRTLIIDKTGPYMVLNYPDGLNNVTSNNVTFNFTAYDSMSENLTCDIWLSGAIEWPSVAVTNSTSHVETKILNDGDFDWYVDCMDIAENGNTSIIINFTVEAPPTVTLISPPNTSWLNYTNVTLIYYAEDWIGFSRCELIVDDVVVDNDTSVFSFVNSSFNHIFSQGYHTWTVNCTDADNNYYIAPSFNLTIDSFPPELFLNVPVPSANLSYSEVNFSFNVTDNMATELYCNINLNGTVYNANATNNTEEIFYINLTDKVYYWNVTCLDYANNTDVSETLSFNLSQSPSIYDLIPQNNSWFNYDTLEFYFNISDNDGFTNCSIYLDGTLNNTKTASFSNGGMNNINVSGISNGYHSWYVKCFDNGTYQNSNYSFTKYFYIDTIVPYIVLNNPEHGNATANDTVLFNFTVYDNLWENLTCNLTLDGSVVYPIINTTNSTPYTQERVDVSFGIHYWNVTCWDGLNNTNTSATYNFTVPTPDLMVNDSSIFFSEDNPIEGANITINATIYNVGDSTVSSAIVQFFEGNYTLNQQIGSNITITNLSSDSSIIVGTNFIVGIGNNNIFVVVDPPISSNGSVTEDNEYNNVVNKTLGVSSWQYVLGYKDAQLQITNPLYRTLFQWTVENVTGANVFAADVDSSITWFNLTAISRNVSDAYVLDDFHDIDTSLSMENNTDSVNITYTNNGLPSLMQNITVFNRPVNNVPFTNSTNSSNFLTGILWDSGDGGTSYNQTQDIIFVTQSNMNATGYNGTYDFEIRLPARLREYVGGTSAVALYVELN